MGRCIQRNRGRIRKGKEPAAVSVGKAIRPSFPRRADRQVFHCAAISRYRASVVAVCFRVAYAYSQGQADCRITHNRLAAGVVLGNQRKPRNRFLLVGAARFYSFISFYAYIHACNSPGDGVGCIGVDTYQGTVNTMGLRMGHNLSFFPDDSLGQHFFAQKVVAFRYINPGAGFRPGFAFHNSIADPADFRPAGFRFQNRSVSCLKAQAVRCKDIVPTGDGNDGGTLVNSVALIHDPFPNACAHAQGFGGHGTGTAGLQQKRSSFFIRILTVFIFFLSR